MIACIHIRRLVRTSLVAGLLCAASASAAPRKTPPELRISPADLTVLANRTSSWIASQGLILRDSVLDRYTNRLLEVVMEQAGGCQTACSVLVVRSPDCYAFSMINGRIYLFTGILAAMQSEAELALLIGHEFAHVKYNHVLKQHYEVIVQTRRATLNMASDAGSYSVFGAAVQSIHELRKNLGGYSRGQESRCDEHSLLWVVNAGYRADQALRIFEHLDEEDSLRSARAGEDADLEDDADAPEVQSDEDAYSTHPTNKQRMDRCMARLRSKHIPLDFGNTLEGVYSSRVAAAVLANSRLLAAGGDFDRALSRLHRYYAPDSAATTAVALHASICAKRGTRSDNDSALADYRSIVAGTDDHADALREIGYLFMKRGETDSARSYMEYYLQTAFEPDDSSYVKYYLKCLEIGKK